MLTLDYQTSFMYSIDILIEPLTISGEDKYKLLVIPSIDKFHGYLPSEGCASISDDSDIDFSKLLDFTWENIDPLTILHISDDGVMTKPMRLSIKSAHRKVDLCDCR